RASHEDDGPRFIAWRYDRGELSIHVEGFGEQTDGEMLLSYSPEVGVEIGGPTVLAFSGEPSMLLFKGLRVRGAPRGRSSGDTSLWCSHHSPIRSVEAVIRLFE